MNNFSALTEEQKNRLAEIRSTLPELTQKTSKTREFGLSIHSKAALYEAVKAIDSMPSLTICSRIGICKENIRKYGCGLLKVVQVIE